MSRMSGKNVRLSPFRRMVIDLMHFSQKVPSVTADRRFDLATVVDARKQCSPRPSWSAIFTKAYGIVARDYPELRQSFLKFPWPRIYQHPHNIGEFNIEREVNGERIVMYCLIRGPENRSLAELDGIVRVHKNAPVEQLRSYKRFLGTSQIPWPFRRLFWWAALNVFGRRRCHNFGTFGMSSIAAQGAGLLRLIPILTSTLHYGLLDEQSRVDMRLSWDHRITDGATIGNVLVDLERTLNAEIVEELRNMARVKSIAA